MTHKVCDDCQRSRYVTLHCEEQDDGSAKITVLTCKHWHEPAEDLARSQQQIEAWEAE